MSIVKYLIKKNSTRVRFLKYSSKKVHYVYFTDFYSARRLSAPVRVL